MTHYRVEFIEICTTVVNVEAAGKEQAKTFATDKLISGYDERDYEADEILVLDLDAGEYQEYSEG